jgi:hypothetical protein
MIQVVRMRTVQKHAGEGENGFRDGYWKVAQPVDERVKEEQWKRKRSLGVLYRITVKD